MSSTAPEGYAWVEKHTNKFPTLHAGKLTAVVLDDFDLACSHVFDAKDTATDKRVSVILACFQDQKIINWYRPTKNRERLLALSYTEFLSELRTKFLDPDWQTDLRTKVMSMRQDDHRTFDDFATTLIGHASLLVDDPLSDTLLRHHLEAGMSEDLRYIYMRDKDMKVLIAKDDLDIDVWVREVNKLDDDRRRDLDRQRRLIQEHNKENKRKTKESNDTDEDRASKKHQNGKGVASKPPSGTSGSSSSTKNPYPPKLTELERELLSANEGCTKCRKPFAGHTWRDCPSPATASDVTVVTKELIAEAKRAKTKGASSSSSHPKTVAAVVPPVVDDDSSDESDDEVSEDLGGRTDVSNCPTSPPPPFPHADPHLVWPCLVEGPMSNLPLTVNALIDNGAFIVMIHEDLVDKLQLRRHKLHEPIQIDLALADSSAPSTSSLTEYVKLRTISLDQSWTSNSVRAIIAPNLCAPIILGLPWLRKNHIVVDH
ncbi:hypothetical protein B0H16DRAFT_837114, partial [Mycena metata]